MTAHDQFDELVAGYALGALDPSDRQEFEAHLTTCDVCQTTLAELRDVAAGIGAAIDDVAPPAALRLRTLHRATGQRPAASPSASQPIQRSAPSWWRLATAASLALALASGAYAVSLQRQLATTRQMLTDQAVREAGLRNELARTRESSARLTNTLSVLRSSNMIRVDLRGSAAASAAVGRAFVSTDRGVIFNADRLPALGPKRTYQLWVIPGGAGAAPVSAGVFTVDADGATALSIPLPAGIATVAAVAVSEEPAGGSPGPTSAPLLVGTPVNN